ncbi:TIGR03621 family F420-dependent LLM class oxidoreductase [Streptomonospora sp. S1-112]|uniref:TIGR03621 family F420-dependent LLM class oxidoreductase n=1 Tax=Streptomonospora mangrovi TaxID=2883123 RepID=A0A9X3SIR6_9ACTN|nr:TIGR03621 family F420-dependent LLM class oxidoreductase [Streptomonospora mangrovi]MDA0566579.1 TIGR03621 family F420-dependent LLM class oxidoreductase [Streptomonospora mangrovi]
MKRFRFGINCRQQEIDRWTQTCRATERLGYDVIQAPDHLGAASPFAMLAAAAAVTSRIRLGTLVLNNEFWNPALLAREAATVDRLSGGRLELGLGAGHMRSEFEAADIPWRPHAERVANLERSIGELDRLFAEDGQQPLPTQVPRPPLLIGGHGERSLDLAARHADIVGFAGLTQVRGARMGTFRVADAEETLRRVDFVRSRAGSRADALEFNVLVQAVVVTDDAHKTAAELAAAYSSPGLDTAEAVLASPYVLVGTAAEIAGELVANRERFGFSYITTHGAYRDALAEAIPLVRRQAGEQAGEQMGEQAEESAPAPAQPERAGGE